MREAQQLSQEEVLVLTAQAEYRQAQEAITRRREILQLQFHGSEESVKQATDEFKRLEHESRRLDEEFYGTY